MSAIAKVPNKLLLGWIDQLWKPEKEPGEALPPSSSSISGPAPKPKKDHLKDLHSWMDDIPIAEVAMPIECHSTEQGYQGICPWHDSVSGNDFSIDIEKNEWHCWRHETGGGPIEAIAIKAGLIECGQTPPGWKERNPEVYRAACLEAAALGYRVPRYIEKPEIKINARDLDELSDESLKALVDHNNPPVVFSRLGSLVRLKNLETSTVLEVLSEAALRGLMARSARYMAITEDKLGNEKKVPKSPPLDAVRDILSLQEWLRIPGIKAIINSPVIRADGSIVLSPGYDEESQLYYVPAHDLVMPEIPERPSLEEAEAAAQYILQEVLGDFPFEDDSSKANALAGMLTPIMRPLIGGPTPLLLLDKPAPGTGATLIMKIIGRIATGQPCKLMGFPKSEDEVRKAVISALLAGDTIICIDDIARELRSDTLNRVLTAIEINDRILGQSKNAVIPNMASWMATGNNLQTHKDIARRSYWVRLDAKMAQPQSRTGFKHEDIEGWVRLNRGDILSKLLIMVKAWYIAGQPKAKVPKMGSFEAWSHMVGSVLAYTGITGFLENSEQLWQNADVEGQEWEAFLKCWNEELPGKYFPISDLIREIQGDGDKKGNEKLLDALPEVLALSLKSPEAKRVWGYAFRKQYEKMYPGGVYLDKKGIHNHVMAWGVAKKDATP